MRLWYLSQGNNDGSKEPAQMRCLTKELYAWSREEDEQHMV